MNFKEMIVEFHGNLINTKILFCKYLNIYFLTNGFCIDHANID